MTSNFNRRSSAFTLTSSGWARRFSVSFAGCLSLKAFLLAEGSGHPLLKLAEETVRGTVNGTH